MSEIPFHTGGFFFFFVTEHCPCEVRVFFSVWLFAIVFRLFCSRDGNTTHTRNATQRKTTRVWIHPLSYSGAQSTTLSHHGLSSQTFPHLIKPLTNAPTHAPPPLPSPVDLCSSFLSDLKSSREVERGGGGAEPTGAQAFSARFGGPARLFCYVGWMQRPRANINDLLPYIRTWTRSNRARVLAAPSNGFGSAKDWVKGT